jgi:geranylgeranyl reductase family protein
MENSYDIIIVGAGPAGSATAIDLAKRGYRVAMIDKEVFPRDKLCGDFVNPINWPLFDTLGVAERVRAQPHAVVRRFRLTTHLGAQAQAPFPLNGREDGFGLGLRRVALDQVLLEKAEEMGVSIFQGYKATKLERRTGAWIVEVVGSDMNRRLEAPVLVGADGRNSTLAQRAGLNVSGRVNGRAVGAQLHLRGSTINDNVEIHLFAGGYAGLVGLGDGTVNLCLAIDKARLANQSVEEIFFDRCLPHNPYLKKILSGSERVGIIRWTYPVYFPARRSYGERVLLVGDAARVSEPVTGEGIYFAMRSGLLAAAAIDQAFHAGNFSAAFLKRYELNCRREFRSRQILNSLIRFAIYRPRLVTRLTDGFGASERLLDALVGAICIPKAIV